jgi:hypothetical protein
MSELWYYAEGGETRGPLSFADLVGNLSKASDPQKVLVWRKGFDNWKPVSSVSEIAGQMIRPPPLTPPPLPVASPAEPPSKIHEPGVSDDDVGALKDFKPPLSGIAGWLILIAIGRVIQATVKSLQTAREHLRRYDIKKPDHRHRRLLRARRERPSCRSAAEKQYERAAPEKRCQLISLRPRVQPQELRGGHPALSGADALCPMGRSCRK